MSGWLDRANGTMLYERKQNQQVLYVIPISSILGKLPLVQRLMGLPVTQSQARVTDADCGVCQSMGLVMVQNNVALNGTKGESAVIFCQASDPYYSNYAQIMHIM